MASTALALVVAAAVAGPAAPPTPAAAPSTPAAASPPTATSAAPTPSAPPPAVERGPDRGVIGVSLLAAGAGLATGSVVGLTLIEALTTPDRESQAASPFTETLTSVGGAASAAIAGVSAVVIVVGGGLAISAALDAPASATPSAAE